MVLAHMKQLNVPQSGSAAAMTASHNRYGQYLRNRRTPVNPRSTQQGVVRARLGANAAAWRGLTALQRAGWESLATQMSRRDSLGSTYTLNGFLCYCSVNNNLAAAGDTLLAAAPALVTPTAPATVVITLTAAAFSLAYTVTPLAAGQRLFAYCSPQQSAGRSFCNNLPLVQVSAAAAASPFNIFSAYQARLGTPVVGNRVFLSLVTYQGGFLSAPLQVSQVIA